MNRQWPFLKTLKGRIQHIINNNNVYSNVNLYFQDESRFGLKTHTGRCITAKGVKPIIKYQHKFSNTYLWGSYSPINGDSFVWEINGVNQTIFEAYLQAFSKHKPQELKILVIDNAGFHSINNIESPSNIKLLNIPPYSPELNPYERMWHYMKAKFRNVLLKDMNSLRQWLHQQVIPFKFLNAALDMEVKCFENESINVDIAELWRG